MIFGGPRQPRWLPLLKIENSATNHLKIIFSETAGPIGPKLWWNGLQMVLFVSAVTKNRKFGTKSLKNYLFWNYWVNWSQTMVEWSLGGHLSELCPTTRLLTKMVSVTKNKIFSKKSLKNDFLWNCWASWAQTMMEWSSGDPLSEFCPTTLAASQDVRHY